jgi:polyisoprenoid-binding protein YceI
MNKALLSIAIVFLCICAAFSFVAKTEWKISSGYNIRFNGKFADGTFEKLQGTILFDPSDLTVSRFDVTVDVNSINTGKELKNKHAVSEKWFDAEKYPTIHFVSNQISVTDSAFLLKGELELHGIKKDVEIPFKFHQENGTAAFDGSFRVNRGEFGIGKSSGKESDYTTVEIHVPVTK